MEDFHSCAVLGASGGNEKHDRGSIAVMYTFRVIRLMYTLLDNNRHLLNAYAKYVEIHYEEMNTCLHYVI